MNFTACIKSARIKPNYVLNVSIDIPLKSAKILSDRSHGADFAFSPNRINLNKKMKLSIPASSVPKTSRDADSRKISSCLGDTQHTISGINKRKTIQTINSHQKKEKGKNKSCEVSPKRKSSMRQKQKKRKSALSNKNIMNEKLGVLNRFVNESEDNIIKYTNQSSQLKKENQKRQNQRLYQHKQRNQSKIEDLDIEQIREYQKIATERKQHLNYLYLKQKVLVLASVKKIQRAWRNYKTKKLLRSYSNNISLRFTGKMKSSLNNENILTVRSLGTQFRKPKRQLEEVQEIQKKNNSQQSQQSQKQEKYEKGCFKKEKKSKMENSRKEESLKQFQSQQIKKWQQFINEIRQGKKVEDVLENSLKRKMELEKDLKKYKEDSSQSSFESQIKNEKNEEGMTTEQRRKKLQFFQSQIRKIDNENSQINSISEFDYLQASRSNLNNRVNEEIQNQKLKKKLQLFNKLQLLEENGDEGDKLKKQGMKKQEQDNQNSEIIVNQNNQSQNSGQDKLQTHRIHVLQQQQRQLSPLKQHFPELHNKNIIKRQKLTEIQGTALIHSIVEELIYQIFLEISQSDKVVAKMKDLFENHHKKATQNKKPEGICTNLESIKDYLQNLVAYIFQQHPNLFQERLNQPSGPTPLILFKYLRNQPIPQPNPKMLLVQLFEEHWNYASEQIYFDVKFDDQELERNRVDYLKNLTKVYFRAIFQAFNECLQPFRIYGMPGKPYPWKKQVLNVKIPDPRKTVRGAYKKLSSLAMVFCGLHLDDKKHTMSEQIIKEIQNERMNTLLQIQFNQDEYRWNIVDDQQAQVLFELSEFIVSEILRESLSEINNIF